MRVLTLFLTCCVSGPRHEGPGKEGGQTGTRSEDRLSHPQCGVPTSSNPKIGSVTPSEITDQLQGQLNAVERLQYQLTTHELQYAKQQAQHEQIAADQARVTVVSSSSSSETPPPSSRKEINEGRLSPKPGKNLSQLHPAANHVPQVSRFKPTITTSQQASAANEQIFFTSSSDGQASLQEIWRLLDEEESFRSSTPGTFFPGPSQDNVSRSQFPDNIPSELTVSSSDFAVKGRQAVTELKPHAKRPALSRKAAGKAKLTPQKPKIRNYNERDNV